MSCSITQKDLEESNEIIIDTIVDEMVEEDDKRFMQELTKIAREMQSK